MIDIEQQLWGMTPDGEAIILYTLRNAAGAEARLSNYGAAIVGITMPDREGRIANVVPGYACPEEYFGNRATCGQTTGCGPGRAWESRVETNRVVMDLLTEAGGPGAPGEMNVEAIFDFDDDGSLEITYLARTTRTAPVDLACNLCFDLSGGTSTSALDHLLRLNSHQVLELNDRRQPTGRLLDVAGTSQDFQEFRTLRTGADDAFDHLFLIDSWRPGILGEAGCLRDPKSGRKVEVLTSQPCVTIRTSNRDDNPGIAVVCHGCPNAAPRPEFSSPQLHPDQTYCQKSVYRFGTF